MKNELKTIVLPYEQWDRVAPLVTGMFGNAMPQNPQSDTFIARMDGDRLAAFLHVEMLYHFNSLFVDPEYRNQGIAPQLFIDSLSGITPGFSAIVMADRREWQYWARAVGARDLGLCRILRKDHPYHELK